MVPWKKIFFEPTKVGGGKRIKENTSYYCLKQVLKLWRLFFLVMEIVLWSQEPWQR